MYSPSTLHENMSVQSGVRTVDVLGVRKVDVDVLAVREPARIMVLVLRVARSTSSRNRNVQAAQNPSQNCASSFLRGHVGLILACIL